MTVVAYTPEEEKLHPPGREVVKMFHRALAPGGYFVTEQTQKLPAETETLFRRVTTVDSTFITGIAKVGERLIILLDLQKVLSPEEKVDLQAVISNPSTMA